MVSMDQSRYLSSSASLGSIDDRAEYMRCLSQQQLENISVSDILEQDYDHNGFLYKRAQEKVTDTLTEYISPTLLSKWQLRYVILYHEYVLYYKNDRCLKPKGVFSLRGYNRVIRADEMTSTNQRWAFKIIGMRSDDRTWYFGAASEREMRLWMAYFKVTMEKAIHGKARDKSLRILNDLKYTERKLARDEELPMGQGPMFEPGIYEDIEEPLEDSEYLPPKTGPSLIRQLPTPPGSPQSSQPPQTPHRVIPPRPDPLRRGLGSRTQSDPTPPPQRRERTISCLSTPKIRHRSSAPTSPGSRPKFPEPPLAAFQQSGLSITSTESGDYILPSDIDTAEADQRPRKALPLLPTTGQPIQSRQAPRPQPNNNNTKRQGPDGDSFRRKKFEETTNSSNNLQEVIAALKPVISKKPTGLDTKPRPSAKPETPLKPSMTPRAAKVPMSPKSDGQSSESQRLNRREPIPSPRVIPQPVSPRAQAMPKPTNWTDLLPDSCHLNSSDKRVAEAKLFEHRFNGMYLIRLSAGSGQVLMVYHENLNQCKHYKIFVSEMNTVSLTTEPIFQTTLQLLQHYTTNPLPNTHVQLSKPYPG